MAGLAKVSKGQKLRVKAQDWNTFVDVANQARQRMLNQTTARGERLPDGSVLFRNDELTAIPQYGVGWLSDTVFEGLAVVKQPPNPCVSRIVVASKPSVAGGIGAGWTEGLRTVRVSNWSGIAIGYRLGAQVCSWDAAINPLGPMTVIGKLTEPLVAVQLHGCRADHIAVSSQGLTIAASYIQFGIGYSVDDTEFAAPKVVQ